ncbi:hypothetical protein FACS1894159_08720 [Bacteroidia bacterium]|nr:hypothetical protein FACS1894159_08720 [Bacteroidia bacterium]
MQQGANTEYYRRLIDSGIPVVFFNRTDDRLDAGKVVIDDYRMAFFAVEHLIIGRGEPFRTRIMHLRGPESISNSTLRWQGYCDVLRKYGIEPEGSLVRRCAEISRQAGYDAMMTALDEGLVPEAVFGFNDPLSIGAMKALKRRGYRIPQDVAVMGFSESQSALLVDPPLSSVAQPLDRMGESAARLLLEKIDDPSAENRTVVLQADINIRESSDETKIGQYIPLP